MTTLGSPVNRITTQLCRHGLYVDNNAQPDNKNYRVTITTLSLKIADPKTAAQDRMRVATASIKKPIHNVKEEPDAPFHGASHKLLSSYLE